VLNSQAHPENRGHQFFAVANASQAAGVFGPGIDLKAGARLLREPPGPVVVGGQFDASAPQLTVVFFDILDPEIGYRDLSITTLRCNVLGISSRTAC
jgi:hypothetical protein